MALVTPPNTTDITGTYEYRGNHWAAFILYADSTFIRPQLIEIVGVPEVYKGTWTIIGDTLIMTDSFQPERYAKEYLTKSDTIIISERIDSLMYAVIEMERKNPLKTKYKIIDQNTLINKYNEIYTRIDTLILPKIFYEHPLMQKNK